MFNQYKVVTVEALIKKQAPVLLIHWFIRRSYHNKWRKVCVHIVLKELRKLERSYPWRMWFFINYKLSGRLIYKVYENVREVWSFKRGKLHGIYKKYFLNGHIYRYKYYRKGKQHGYQVEFNSIGEIISLKKYECGQEIKKVTKGVKDYEKARICSREFEDY